MSRRTITEEQGRRLATARAHAGFKSARAAALEFGWPESSYRAHENGSRTMGLDDAERYSKKFRSYGAKVVAQEILFGEDQGPPPEQPRLMVPLIGYVGAGSEANFFDSGQGAGEFDYLVGPDGSTETTVAVEIRGTSLGELFDRWMVFYDEVRRPPTNELIGRLCVCGLDDERVLVKKLARGRRRGKFDLISNTEPPLYDQIVVWAARVKQMAPR